jgi:hypothetical protein
MGFKAWVNFIYKTGELIIIRRKALSQDSAFSIGLILSTQENRMTKTHNDLWNTKELIWEKVYKVLTLGKIISINYYDIKGKVS